MFSSFCRKCNSSGYLSSNYNTLITIPDYIPKEQYRRYLSSKFYNRTVFIKEFDKEFDKETMSYLW